MILGTGTLRAGDAQGGRHLRLLSSSYIRRRRSLELSVGSSRRAVRVRWAERKGGRGTPHQDRGVRLRDYALSGKVYWLILHVHGPAFSHSVKR
eukprot:5598008-Prymnesium_polylepis.1